MKTIIRTAIILLCIVVTILTATLLTCAKETAAPAAKVITSDGYGLTLSKGSLAWSNREQHVMNTYPALLDGRTYIYSMINVGYTVTVTSPGIIYIITTEKAAPQYTELGFTRIDDIEPFKMHSNFNDPTIVLQKVYTSDDIKSNKIITVNKNNVAAEWAVVFADCVDSAPLTDMAVISATDNGILTSWRKGAKLVKDRAYTVGELPSWITKAGDLGFVCGNNAWKSTAVAETDGKIYAVVLRADAGNVLTAAGFTAVPEYKTFRLFPGVLPDNEKSVLYVKNVKKGDSVSIDTYCAVFMGLTEGIDERDAALKTPAVYTNNTPEGKAELESKTSGYCDGTRKWQGIPGIGITDINGRLWATWYSGGSGECYENYVILTTSNDKGATWSDAKVVIDPDKTGYVRAFDPVLWTDPNGRMWVFWNQEFTYNNAWAGTDGRIGVWAMYTKNPDSENPDWSEPVRLCNNVIMNKPLVTNDGDWLLCAYMINGSSNDQTDPAELGPCLFRFTEYDKEWEKWSQINKTVFSFPDAFCEHMAVQNSDGSITVLIRTTMGTYATTTSDKGKTWTKAVQFKDGATGKAISKTNSRPFIMTLSSGAQMILYHDTTSDIRNNLTAALSYDNGKTWTEKLLLDNRNNVSYPDAVQAKDGTIYITYDYDRYGDMSIMLAKITQADIENGSVKSPNSKLKMIINNNGKVILDDWYKIKGVAALDGKTALLAAENNTGKMILTDIGANAFLDRAYTLSKIPAVFRNTCFVSSLIDAGQTGNSKTRVKVLSGGYVYAITPCKGEKWCEIDALTAQGFKIDAGFGSLTQLFTQEAESLCVMKKLASTGEVFETSKYVIFIGDSCAVHSDRHVAVNDAVVEPTCTVDGLTAGSHCSLCGNVLTKQTTLKATGHTWDDGYVTKAPTDTEDGIKTYSCTVCKETYTKVISHIDPSNTEGTTGTGNDTEIDSATDRNTEVTADPESNTVTEEEPENSDTDSVDDTTGGENEQNTDSTTENTDTGLGNRGYIYIISAVILLLLLGASATVIIMKRKKTTNT